MSTPKSDAARLLGALGGLARARKLPPERRKAIARKASRAALRKRKGLTDLTAKD